MAKYVISNCNKERVAKGVGQNDNMDLLQNGIERYSKFVEVTSM